LFARLAPEGDRITGAAGAWHAGHLSAVSAIHFAESGSTGPRNEEIVLDSGAHS
jgi:hypothetical protein